MHNHAIRFLLTLLSIAVAGCEGLSFDRTIKDTHREDSPHAQMKAEAAPTPRINPSTHIAAGQMLEKRGDFAGAIDQYEKAVAAAPKDSAGYNRLGIVYQKIGRLADADQMFRQALAVDPRSAMLHNNLGYTQLLQQQVDAAEESFRKALTLAPEFKRARMNLAIAAAQAGRLDESATEFSRVVPGDVAYYNVAVICLQKGDRAGGIRCLTRALEFNPDCPGARDQLARLTRAVPMEKETPRAATMEKEPVRAASEPVAPLAGDPARDATP